MQNWKFEREEPKFEAVKGKHRIRIKSAEMAISRSGNDMLSLQFDVSGSGITVYHYIVFLAENPEITNRMLTQFFDSFGIQDGDFNLNGYVGKTGAAMLREDEDYGSTKIHYFLNKNQQTSLPAWREKGAALTQGSPINISSDDLPF